MTEPHPFVSYLEGLREDRGALASLRRGLGRPPGTVADMYRYVVRWLPDDAPRWREDAYYLIAALFAYHAVAGAGQKWPAAPCSACRVWDEAYRTHETAADPMPDWR